jgi:hypothetical protein
MTITIVIAEETENGTTTRGCAQLCVGLKQ